MSIMKYRKCARCGRYFRPTREDQDYGPGCEKKVLQRRSVIL